MYFRELTPHDEPKLVLCTTLTLIDPLLPSNNLTLRYHLLNPPSSANDDKMYNVPNNSAPSNTDIKCLMFHALLPLPLKSSLNEPQEGERERERE